MCIKCVYYGVTTSGVPCVFSFSANERLLLALPKN